MPINISGRGLALFPIKLLQEKILNINFKNQVLILISKEIISNTKRY